MTVEEKVKGMVEQAIEDDKALFLVGVKLKGNPGNQRLLIWLDGDAGVTIDQCVKVNRKLSEVLDEENLIEGKYQLEVSSAGIDHPLQFLRQYKKNVGRSLKVQLKDGSEVKGKLVSVDKKAMVLLKTGKKSEEEVTIDFDLIEQSKVLVSFK